MTAIADASIPLDSSVPMKAKCQIQGEVVYKYGTGDSIPPGAIYLTTIVETNPPNFMDVYRYVWHYFRVPIHGVRGKK